MLSGRNILIATALVGLAVTIAGPALDNGFSLDDFNWLARVDFRSSTGDFLLTPEPGQLANPGARLLWLSVFAVFGVEAMPYHALLLLLHGVVVVLLWLLATETVDTEIGLLAATLFCAQTAGAEAVFWFAASPHVLVSALIFVGALGIVRYVAINSLPAIVGGLTAFVSAMLTKGTAIAVLPVAVGWNACCPSAPRHRKATVVLALGLLTVAVIVFNLSIGSGESYLVERGLYRFGGHMLGNAATSVGMVILPWSGIAAELGLSNIVAGARTVLGIAGLVAAAGIFILGSGRLRWWTALALMSLAPTLPFVMEPTSRYVYLPSAAASVVAAVLISKVIRRRGLRLAVVVALCLAGVADMRLRDNHFEYRERLMSDMVDQITTVSPSPPADGVVKISGLPRLGLEPGIHLEAALKLEWDDPSICIELVSEDQTERPGVLIWHDGRVTAGTTESPSAD